MVSAPLLASSLANGGLVVVPTAVGVATGLGGGGFIQPTADAYGKGVVAVVPSSGQSPASLAARADPGSGFRAVLSRRPSGDALARTAEGRTSLIVLEGGRRFLDGISPFAAFPPATVGALRAGPETFSIDSPFAVVASAGGESAGAGSAGGVSSTGAAGGGGGSAIGGSSGGSREDGPFTIESDPAKPFKLTVMPTREVPMWAFLRVFVEDGRLEAAHGPTITTIEGELTQIFFVYKEGGWFLAPPGRELAARPRISGKARVLVGEVPVWVTTDEHGKMGLEAEYLLRREEAADGRETVTVTNSRVEGMSAYLIMGLDGRLRVTADRLADEDAVQLFQPGAVMGWYIRDRYQGEVYKTGAGQTDYTVIVKGVPVHFERYDGRTITFSQDFFVAPNTDEGITITPNRPGLIIHFANDRGGDVVVKSGMAEPRPDESSYAWEDGRWQERHYAWPMSSGPVVNSGGDVGSVPLAADKSGRGPRVFVSAGADGKLIVSGPIRRDLDQRHLGVALQNNDWQTDLPRTAVEKVMALQADYPRMVLVVDRETGELLGKSERPISAQQNAQRSGVRAGSVMIFPDIPQFGDASDRVVLGGGR